MSIRISALCRTLHSPLHSWLISILLSRNRLRSLPGEAHVRTFYFCKFPTVLVVSYLFSFFISIFCFSDSKKKFGRLSFMSFPFVRTYSLFSKSFVEMVTCTSPKDRTFCRALAGARISIKREVNIIVCPSARVFAACK